MTALLEDLAKPRPGDEFPDVGYVRRMKALLANPDRTTAGTRHPLVGLVGKKRAGKDTFARTLVEERAFTRFAFADPLKEAVLALNPVVPVPVRLGGMTGEQTRNRRLADVVREVGWEEAKENREVRRLLQEFGVGIRAIQEDFWVRATLDRAIAHAEVEGPAVITDVRFPNEAEEIERAGGVLVRIIRPDQDATDSHPSETAMDGYPVPFVVENSGTLEDLASVARSTDF